MLEEVAALKADNERLQQDVKRLRTDLDGLEGNSGEASADSLLAQLRAANRKHASQTQELTATREEQNRLRIENEALDSKVIRLEERIATLEAENRSILRQSGAPAATTGDAASIDSLSRQLRDARRSIQALEEQAGEAEKDFEDMRVQNVTQYQQIQDLERKLASVEAENARLRANTPVGNPAVAGSTADRDSLILLRSRMDYLNRKAAEGDRNAQLLATRDEELRKSETEKRALRTQLDRTETDLKAAGDQRKLAEQKLQAAQANVKSAQDAAAQAKADKEKLQKEKADVEGRLAKVMNDQGKGDAQRKFLADSINALNTDLREREGQIRKRDEQIRREIVTRDSLANAVKMGEYRENDLRRITSQLQTRLDSMQRAAVPETEQQKYLRDQRAKLSELEKQLEARNTSSKDQEKLLNQRQAFVEKQEADLKAREANILNLEERERQVKLREQQADARENIGGVTVNPQDVKENMVVEFGSSVPVFTITTSLSYRAAQRQVVAYMLSRDILLSAQFPDLYFQNISLPELSEGQLEMKVRIDSKDNSTVLQVSFKLPDGNYLGTERTRKQNESARQLIVRMLRYKV